MRPTLTPMPMSQPARRLTLTCHVVASVGWIGALGVFLAHAMLSWGTDDAKLLQSAATAMSVSTWYVILPMALLSLLTGVLQALGTQWGLLKHFWVIFKLLLTVLATAVLLLKMQPISELAEASSSASAWNAQMRQSHLSLLVHAAGGLAILLAATVLAVYKPAGQTPWGTQATGQRVSWDANSVPRWARVFGSILGLLAVVIALMILSGRHGPWSHLGS